MPTSTNVTNLKINELTEAQYDAAVLAGIIGANELSILTDASSGGGDGIDWKTKVDLASDVKPTDWDISPVFTIAGGLPDGDYECYYQAKVSCSTMSNGGPAGVITYKLCFNVNNTNNSVCGSISPVIDGNWVAPQGKRLPSDDVWIYGFACHNIVDNGDLIMRFYDSNFSSNIHGYIPNLSVPECFKLSAIKNTTTGTEYIATGAIYDNESYTSLNSAFVLSQLVQYPEVPDYYHKASTNSSYVTYWYLSGGVRFNQNSWDESAEISVAIELGNDRFEMTLKTFISDYELTVDTATGVFAGTQVGLYEGMIHVVPNFPVGTTGIVYYSAASKGGDNSVYMSYTNEQVPAGITMLNVLKVGETPTAINYLGKIRQYDGTTTAYYTNGHFYKATGTITTIPASAHIYDVSPSGTTVSMDVDGFVSAVVGITGWFRQDVINNINNGYQMVYDNVTQSFSWGAYGTFSVADSATLMAYITITPTPTGTDNIGWVIDQYVAGSRALTNGAWEEVAVQTTATTPSTMPTLLAANWSSNTQTVSVQGVTASNIVMVSPAPASASDYASAGIVCTAQGSGTLTFTCTSVPTNDITVNVALF